MKKVTIHHIDAFTDTLFGGNPAGVVENADVLSDEEMKHIAREVNLSETAFILKPTQKNADIKLRYFTSGKSEIKFCGHATVAALYEIARRGLYGTEKEGTYTFHIETNAGILPMNIIKKSQNGIAVIFTAPAVRLQQYKSQHKELADRLGIPFDSLSQQAPIMIDQNLNYIYVAINSLKQLGQLEFNFQKIMGEFKKEGIIVFCLLTPEAFDKKNDIHARGLAPFVGVPEDPFTGSMQAGLATYAIANHMVPAATSKINTEQGYFIGRPGFATIEVKGSSIFVRGKAAHVFSGEIIL